MSLRARNRLAAMRRIQECALRLFEQSGFEAISIEEIASVAEVSPSTVYRYFGTKEGIVVWEREDQSIEAEFLARLKQLPPAAAFRDALIATLGASNDASFLLRRVRFIYATPQVHAAAIERDFSDRDELAIGFAKLRRSRKPQLQDQVLAAICMAALDAALQAWQQANGKKKLAALLKEAFEVAASFELSESTA